MGIFYQRVNVFEIEHLMLFNWINMRGELVDKHAQTV